MTTHLLPRSPARVAAAGLLAALALVASGCGTSATVAPEAARVTTTPPAPTRTAEPTPAPAPTTPPEAGEEAPDGTAAALLATLPVKGRAPMTGYSRDRFGPAWLDADRNGCDTRNDVLAEHLTNIVLDPGTRDCVVLSGRLEDAYTGSVIEFVRGDGFLVDVDHVVALGNAWATGAFRWDVKKRAALANDPLNLLPVDASANRQKGDGDAATWLPPHRGHRCEYVARQVSVKAKYGLWVTPAERAAMEQVLGSCPGQPPAADSGAPARVDLAVTDPGAPGSSTPRGPVTRAPAPGSAVHYENCTAARAAGAAPVRRGDPGYGTHLDRDGDGVGCE